MILAILAGVTIVAAAGWGAGALWFQSPRGGAWRALSVACWLALAGAALLGLALEHAAPLWLFGAALLGLLAWWRLGVRPSNARSWMPEVARTTCGDIDGDRVTLHDVRDFDWRTRSDYDVRWRTETYDLSRLESVDVALSYWGRPRSPMRWCPLASATAGTWCSRSRYAASWAMRSPRSGLLPPVRAVGAGVHRRDSLRVRTNVRGEDGYLYRVHMPEGGARALFLAYVETANGLARQPRFYNTLTANCITIVYQLARRIVPGLPMDYRLLLSGYLPEYLYRIGALRGADSARPIATPAAIPTARARPTRRSSRAISARACPANEEGFLAACADCPDGAVFILGRPGYENLWSARFCKRGGVGVNWACSNLFGVSWG